MRDNTPPPPLKLLNFNCIDYSTNLLICGGMFKKKVGEFKKYVPPPPMHLILEPPY